MGPPKNWSPESEVIVFMPYHSRTRDQTHVFWLLIGYFLCQGTLLWVPYAYLGCNKCSPLIIMINKIISNQSIQWVLVEWGLCGWLCVLCCAGHTWLRQNFYLGEMGWIAKEQNKATWWASLGGWSHKQVFIGKEGSEDSEGWVGCG